MPHITIVAGGTRGDTQPYIALGTGLRSAGHEVRIVTSDDFETLVTDAGLGFASSGPSVEARLQSDAWRKTTESGNFIKVLSHMRAEMKQAADESAQRLPDLLRGSDLLVTGMAGMSGAFSVAEQLHIPVVQAYVVPFAPTREFAAPLVPGLPLGGALNRLSFRAMHQLFWQSFKVSDTYLRQALGLPKQSFWGPFAALERSGAPVLYGYSPHVLPQPRDWPATHQVTGYWFLHEPAEWTPPAGLQAFLQAGPPPIYLGFGSVSSRDPQTVGHIAVEALERTGQRGILAAGWGGLQSAALPATVYAVGSVPHTWLFERMAAVVHHGGAGTTAAGLRAGVPSVVVPFGLDQPFWGRRVAGLGVGPAPIPRRQLTVDKLAAAIARTVEDDALRRKAAALGAAIRSEDGVGAAVTAIERFVGRLTAAGAQPGRHAKDARIVGNNR